MVVRTLTSESMADGALCVENLGLILAETNVGACGLVRGSASSADCVSSHCGPVVRLCLCRVCKGQSWTNWKYCWFVLNVG